MLEMQILIFGLLMFTSSMLMAEQLRFAQMTNSPDQIVGAAVLKVVYAKAGVPIDQTIFPKNKEGIVDGCESLRGK